jgi:hypothetical protein
MSWSRTLATAAVALLAAGCSSGIKVETDASPTANFSNYKTYAIGRLPEQAKSADAMTGIGRQRAELAINSALAAKGMQKVDDPSQADVVVFTYATTKERMDINTYGGGYTYAGGRWGGYYGSPTTTSVNYYNEGTLIVDIADPKAKQLVWRGIASGTVGDQKETQKKAEEGIKQIMAKCPLGAGGSKG